MGVIMKFDSVLIIDDEVDIVEGLSEALVGLFENVSKAQNGEEAFGLAINQKFDLIISDIMMPKMKGDDFLRKLRMKGIHTPIIFITGNGSKDNLISALRLGAVDFIEKPFDIDQFLNIVTRTMEFVQEKLELEKLQANSTVDSDKSILENQKKAVGIMQVAKYLKGKAQ
jgi:DNA-binding NtrC family response regulator